MARMFCLTHGGHWYVVRPFSTANDQPSGMAPGAQVAEDPHRLQCRVSSALSSTSVSVGMEE